METTTVDASQHLPLIYRVIGQMGLTGDLAEEAYSESLVTITKAAKSYDPSYGVPVAHWLARNIRGGIQNWLRKQRRTAVLEPAIAAAVDVTSARIELNEVLVRVNKLLTPEERKVIIMTAIEYRGVEIAKKLGMTTVQVHRLKRSAQKKLRGE